jgi:hypothetical protein
MVKMRYQVDAEEDAAIRKAAIRSRAELKEAYAQVKLLESHDSPDSTELQAARAKLEHLKFVFEDHAPEPKTHAQMLAEYAARMRKFWEERK